MTGFDYAFLALVALSCLLGLWRGLVSEIISLLGWLIALACGWYGAGPLSVFFPIASESMRWIAAFALIFISILVVLAVLRQLIKSLLAAAGMGAIDRILGAGFGLLRALLVAVLLVMVAGLTTLPKELWWRESLFAPPLETVVIMGKPWLPDVIAKRIRYR